MSWMVIKTSCPPQSKRTGAVLIRRMKDFQKTYFTKLAQNNEWKKSWKMMYNTCGCTSQQLNNHAKSWKMVMQNHEKWSCKSCTRLSPLWQKTKKNDVWYVGGNLPKMQNHEIWSCKIMQTMHKTSTIVTGSKNHGKWCVICMGYLQKTAKSCKMVMKNHANHAQD